MNINDMTRKQFEDLQYLDGFDAIDIDSIVLLPTRKHHDSGYNIYEVIACSHCKALGKLYGYDTFSIYIDGYFNRVGVDCLRNSCLMRIFLPDEYEIIPASYMARKRKEIMKSE